MSSSVMDVLTQDVRKFLMEMRYDTPEAFLDAPSADVAKQYTDWRVHNNKPSLRQDPVLVVYAWKQEVIRKMRPNDAADAATGPPVETVYMDNTPSSKRSKRFKLTTPKKKKKKSPNGTDETSFDPPHTVWHPHGNDVLAGRGGLTNQHPGNEWFRRLVRCSRGFYKGCPKHTKMSVAKAVVRSVHCKSPPGRFLELVPGPSGRRMWKEIEYKKAVDKASQALREKWEHSTDDQVLQESMQLMFSKKLDSMGGIDEAPKDAVEEAVYFAVTTVALEYAKRWGTPSFRSLTEVLRPIVTAASKAKQMPIAPKPTHGHTTRSIVASVNVNTTAPFQTIAFPSAMPTSTKMLSSQSALVKNFAEAVAIVPMPPIPPSRAVSAPQHIKPTSLPQRAMSSPPLNFYNASGGKKHNPGKNDFGSPIRKSTPPRKRKPLPFSNKMAPPTTPDTFGAPAPPEIVAASSKKMDISEDSSSLSPMRSKVYGDDIKAHVDDEWSGSILGRTASLVSPPPPGEYNIASVRRAKSPSPSISRQSLAVQTITGSCENKSFSKIGVKRKMTNIATAKEIEAEIRKRPKSHGMSPFHKELLKMNLTSIVDW